MHKSLGNARQPLIRDRKLGKNGPRKTHNTFLENWGMNVKLLKACAFCRKRKLKCSINGDYQKCENCVARGIQCVFDHKKIRSRSRKPKWNDSDGGNSPSSDLIHLQRRHSTGEVASSPAQSPKTYHLSPIEENFNAQSFQFRETPYGAFAMESPDLSESPTLHSGSLGFSPGTTESLEHIMPVQKLYRTNIEPYTPFVNPKINWESLDRVSKLCLNIASVSSPISQIPMSTNDLLLEMLHDYFQDDNSWDESSLSCFFLLPLRTNIADTLVQHNLQRFDQLFKHQNNLSTNLIVGACTVDAYYSLLNGSWTLKTDPRVLVELGNYLDSLNENSFSYHFLSVAYLLYKFVSLISNKKLSYDNLRLEMLQLEYDMLLWPAKLTQELSVLEDDLLATPEAFLLHVLHNTLLIEFYYNAVKNRDTFGKMNSIFGVPGLYRFIAGMAKSNFKVQHGLVGRWSIISGCQLHNAKRLLDLYEIMEYELFVPSLKYYKKASNIYDTEYQEKVYSQVQQLIKNEGYYNEQPDDSDGPSIFWGFRDVRSMSLQTYIDEAKDRVFKKIHV
ncbi:hypothetical protein JA9_004333 [Meyerozyma sp. JA9]|nr:hypothetical protein JA9_004333 [Meyerozyma sp. JA9]